ncbi:EamA family transporter [Sphingobacterium sp. UT-1RO-CII-1]|uniref:EamA family transporter n=1 Tax=Sphingobacterium sp. UT-1RO-CII-1 TaxID=2995225 RepID=UPI00227C553B|nr:EamA family transporter [Sphingobacterium sp. UT-1RO-CII-1]MCY4778518.1 EamA family transporter [Sphingobacterium sp. UT-1RO-CII-1]
MPDTTQLTTSRRNHFFAAFLAPVIWGFMILPFRWLQAWDAADILNYRVLSATVISWLIILFFRRGDLHHDVKKFKSLPSKNRKHIIWLTISASFLLVSNWYTYIYAVNSISIQSAAFAYMICPLITTLGAFFLLREQLSRTQWVALFLALGSVILLSQGSIYHVLWSVLIATLYAFYIITQRVTQGFSKLNLLAFQLLFCSLTILPIMLYQERSIPTDVFFWVIITLVGTIFTIAPLFLSMYSLTRISSSTAGVLLYANPIIAFLLGVFIFKESVSGYQYFAYGLLLVAIILFNSPALKSLKKAF